MRLFKRSEFINLPANTIYSRVDSQYGELVDGIYCKTSGPLDGWTNDWVEQGLIHTNAVHPDDMVEGGQITDFGLDIRDSFQEFRLDYESGGRDGMFDDTDLFVVWDKEDIGKLISYLQNCIK